jgi:hypothetical protein
MNGIAAELVEGALDVRNCVRNRLFHGRLPQRKIRMMKLRENSHYLSLKLPKLTAPHSPGTAPSESVSGG